MKSLRIVLVALLVLALAVLARGGTPSYASTAPAALNTSAAYSVFVDYNAEFAITDLLVSLEYHVHPDEQESYGEQVIASACHPAGADKIESFVATDPIGEELPLSPRESTTDEYCFNYMWFAASPAIPTFGTYTVTATDVYGGVATLASDPTDHVSDRVPTITDPVNHGYVTTGVPTFRWEPFSETTTGYLIEVTGPPEETLPGDDAVWRIGLPSGQTEVRFNSDGAAAVPQLTSGNTYGLIVFAYEEMACDESPCYRDTSVRHIEFTLAVGLPADVDIKPGSDPNSINPRSRGKIPVAILSTPDFDATSEIDTASLTFGATGDEESLAFCSPSPEDVNGDGLLDQVCHFNTQDTGFQCGDTEGILRGQTVDGVPIQGCDSVRTVPPR